MIQGSVSPSSPAKACYAAVNCAAASVTPRGPAPDVKSLMKRITPFQGAENWRSVTQILTSFLPLFGLLYLMFHTYEQSIFLTLVLAVFAAAFVVRIFMIQHDCGHGSFFNSRFLNDWVGRACSIFTCIPYLYWRKQHALHHANTGNLDKRGNGDMYICTVEEYLAYSPWERFKYRIIRNPFFLFVFGPAVLVLVINRVVLDPVKLNLKEKLSVYVGNVVFVLGLAALWLWLGPAKLLCLAAPVLFISACAGVWLFYVQHQFEHTYWDHDEKWNFFKAAVHGSSYYKLPPLLQWITSNIGFHHIHHLAPLVPNYKLPECSNSLPDLEGVPTLTLATSLKTIFLAVWDEKQRRLISFRELARLYQTPAAQTK